MNTHNSTATSVPSRREILINGRDHLLGAAKAAITLVEYGNYECSLCAQAQRVVTQLRQRLDGELRFAYRHFPRALLHSNSQRAAEAAEAAGAQGRFWQMHGLLLEHTHHLDDATIALCAATLELDMPRFLYDFEQGVYAQRVHEDFQSGLRSGVYGTPTFYINGVRHDDYWDVDTLLTAMESSLMKAEHKPAYCSGARRGLDGRVRQACTGDRPFEALDGRSQTLRYGLSDSPVGLAAWSAAVR